MPAVEYYARKMKRLSPLTLHPVVLQPGLEEDPGFNMVSEVAIAEMLQNPFFAQEWQRLQDMQIVRVLDIDKKDPSKSEPDLTNLNLSQAVKRVKASTSLDLLHSWKDVDPRPGVQKAIEDQINAISPPLEARVK